MASSMLKPKPKLTPNATAMLRDHPWLGPWDCVLHAYMDCAGRPRPRPPPAKPSGGRKPKRQRANGVA